MFHLIFYIISVMALSLLINFVIIRNNRKLRKINEDLKLQRTYFKELFKGSQDAIAALDNENRIIDVNKAFEELFKYKDDEIRGKLVDSIIANSDTKDAFKLSKVVMNGGTAATETKRKRKDGKLVDVSVLAFPVILDTDQIGVYAVYKDISDKKKSDHALELQKTYFRKLFESSPEAICIIDTEDRFIDVNYAFEKLFGYSKDELVNHYINDRIVQPKAINEATKISEEVMDGNVIEYEAVRMKKDGTLVDVCILGYPIIFENKQLGVFGTYKDITERKRIEKDLIYMGTHDGLTGLYNRMYFEDLLKKYDKENQKGIGIIVCDLDCLKLVNDNLGHDFGDKLLIHAAKIINNTCKKNNGIAARIGGDEFTIIVADCLKEELETVNERLQKAIDNYNSKNTELYLSISTGLAYRGKEFKTMAELFKKADNNMYCCKIGKKKLNTEKIMVKIIEQVI